VPIAVDTVGQWLALRIIATNAQDRAQVQAVTGYTVEIAFVD